MKIKNVICGVVSILGLWISLSLFLYSIDEGYLFLGFICIALGFMSGFSFILSLTTNVEKKEKPLKK